MSTQVRRRRGTSAEIAGVAPAEGEFFVNTDDNSIHVGDGATLGGHKALTVGNGAAIQFDSVADMVAADWLSVGDVVNSGFTQWRHNGGSSGTLADFDPLTDINAQDFGASPDGITDHTGSVQDAIDAAFLSGKAATELGVDWVASNVIVDPNTKWRYDDIIKFYDGSAAGSGATTVQLSGANFATNELKGAFLWNVTDKSYGTVTGNSANSVTVKALYLGTANTFTISDVIVISKHKVGVNIHDYSKYDWNNNRFTAQDRVYLQCDAPHTTSANERHVSSSYHPAYIVENQGVSDMEKRASFIMRHKNPRALPGDTALDKFFQTSMNAPQNSQEIKNLQYTVVGGGHSYDGVNYDKSSVYSVDLFSIATESVTDRRIGFGIVAQDGYNMYQRAWTTNINKWGINNNGPITEFDFLQGGNIHSTLKFQALRGVTGFGGLHSNGNISLTLADKGIVVCNTDTNSGTLAITLPDATNKSGFTVTIVRTNPTYNVSASPQPGQQILGTSAPGAFIVTTAIGDSMTLTSGGDGNWYVVGTERGAWTFS